MQSAQCISAEQLQRFILGKLDQDVLSQIAQHVDQCQVCQDTVVGLAEQSDTFIENIRDQVPADPFESEAEFRDGLQAALRSAPSARRTESTSSAAAPAQLGPYEIVEQLGTGGMGTVFKAIHTRLQRTVALKILPADRWASAQAVSRFQREMQAIGGLDHPHIVQASDAGEQQGMHYLVMQYVDGLDLSQIVERVGPLSVPDACELIRQTALGLEYIHAQGLVHRDIKPSNLMLAASQRHGDSDSQSSAPIVKILDLGLALLGEQHAEQGHELTTVGQLMGTLDYMAPEQGADSHDVDSRADIYSLGATLFKLLTGRAPFSGPAYNTLLKKVSALATRPAPSIASVRDDLPMELVRVVDRMLSKDAAERYKSPAEVAVALVPFAEDADLSQLLDRAENSPAPGNEHSPVAWPLNSQLEPTNTQSVISRQAATDPVSGNRRIKPPRKSIAWLAAVTALILCAAAGFVISVVTDTGQLTIHSSDPHVSVLVKRGERVVKDIEMARAEDTFTIRSGQYVIEVQGDNADQLKVTPDAFTLSRGQQTVVRIEHHGVERTNSVMQSERARQRSATPFLSNLNPREGEEALKEATNTSKSVLDPVNQPTYDGQTYQQWLRELQTERKEERLTEAMRAFAALGESEHNAQAARAILQVMRRHPSRVITEQGPRVLLISNSRLALWYMSPDVLVQAMIQEMIDGNDNSRDFLTQLIVPVFYGRSTDHSAQFQSVKGSLIKALNDRFEHILAPLLEVSRRDSQRERDWAIDFLIKLCRFTGTQAGDYPPIADRLREELSQPDNNTVLEATSALVASRMHTQSVVRALMRILADDESAKYYPQVIHQLGQLGPAAAAAVDRLTALLKEYLESPSKSSPGIAGAFGIAGGLDGGYGLLSRMGGGFGGDGYDIRGAIIETLGKIGPAAASAVPTIRQAVQGEPSHLKDEVQTALKRINQQPTPYP